MKVTAGIFRKNNSVLLMRRAATEPLAGEWEYPGGKFEDGEDVREVGERLAASYVNFYISNGGVIVPQFSDENDKVAVDILGKLFPTRRVYPIYARDIIVGGGNIHCITQQIPECNC